jgi:uncharacterized protein (TIGR00266 family)
MTTQLRGRVLGHDMQAIAVDLAPNETVIAEAGALIYMDDGIRFVAYMGDGTEVSSGVMGSLWGAAKRAVSGAGMFLTHFTNHTSQTRTVVFGANNPGKILAMKLSDWGGHILCEHHTFLAAEMGTRVDAVFNQRLSAGFFGGAGFVLQKLSGSGEVWLHACGSVIERELNNETIHVEPGALVALSPSLEFKIERAGNLKTMFFGGEGLFLATLSGTGKVLLQSLPWNRVVAHIIEQVPHH